MKLFLKAVRDLRQGWASFGACTLVLVLGVTFYGAMSASYRNLEASYRYTYQRLRFLDFYVELAQAPESVASLVSRLPGVEAALARQSLEVEIEQRQATGRAPKSPEEAGRGAFRASDVPARKIVGRVIGIPSRGRPAINDLKVEEGRYLAPGAHHEALLERTFARYHGYRPGDFIYPKVRGHTWRFKVVGIVTSPEYIWVVRSKEYVMPSPRTFGVLFVSHDDIKLLSGKGGVNEVHVRMADPALRPVAMEKARQLLAPYGAQKPVPREDQPSNKLLADDLRSFEKLAYWFPLLFLVIGGITLYTLLSRVILRQRPQIGILMALGFSHRQVVGHFLTFPWVVGLAGAALGTVAGHFLGMASTRLYASVLGLPYLQFHLYWDQMLFGASSGLAAALLAGLFAVRKVLAMQPAEALYSEVAVQGRFPWIERLFPALSRTSYIYRLPLRNLFRQPGRSLSTALGVALAVAQMLSTLALYDSQTAAIDFYFEKMWKHDMRAVFLHPVEGALLSKVRKWPGVEMAEGILEMPVRLVRGDREYTTLLFGLREQADSVRFFARDGSPLSVAQPGGVEGWALFGRAGHQKLGVEMGDIVRARVPRAVLGDTPGLLLTVGPQLNAPVGTIVYTDLRTARKLAAQTERLPPEAINGIALRVAPAHREEVRRRLYQLPGVAAVEVIRETRQEIDELLKTFDAYKYLMLAFSSALAFVVLFNAVTISTLERVREVATMRTLGIPGRTVARMMAVETLLVWAPGAATGVPLGYFLGDLFLKLYSGDFIHMTLNLEASTVAHTVLGSLILALAALVPSVRLALGMDLARMAKERVS
jgi:putative ABC transport system permease protein